MKFRKKPVEVEARQLTDENAGEIAQWINANGHDATVRGGDSGGSCGGTVLIRTLEGTMTADVGDMVIQGVHGEFYPCKPAVFADSYEPAVDGA